MATNVSGLILSVLYIFILLSPALKADKTFTLDLIEDSDTYHGNLFRRQAGAGWRSTDILYNSSDFQFYVEVNIGDKSKNLRLGVVQNPYTWVASPWNRTQDCPPLTQTLACSRVHGSGFFSLNPPDSSSYRNLSDDFDIEYRDNRYAIGYWGRDKFRLGQLTIDDVNFGVGRFYNATPSIGLERSDSDTPYPTFLEVMQENDIINTPTYGIYVGDIRGREDSGKSISFGGIDVAKFTRPLRTFSSRSDYALDLLSIDIISGGVVASKPLERPTTSPVVADLNFGTAAIHLSSDVFGLVMNDLGARASDDYIINTLPPEGSGLNFTFVDGLSIFVPYSQMIVQIPETTWYLVLLLSNDRNTVLGTPFFRSAYVFYDPQNQEFSIAPALYNISASNITEVGANNASVSEIGWLYEDPSSIISPTESPTPPQPTQSPASETTISNTAIIVGGTVGGVALIIIILAICYYFFFYRPSHPRVVTVVPQMQGPYAGQAPLPAPYPHGYTNEQFSPAKPGYSSPVTSPVSTVSANPWVYPQDNAPNRNPTAYELG
ncbi:hypothetical protein TWF506_008422 [Arthrobotrys conoides]|uniref:Peptidase A1 domain-containing protein n=1 Tax=Arthrobotrys conoides TaxID=74498 RepID=A0AAN8RTZ1_9PEZI